MEVEEDAGFQNFQRFGFQRGQGRGRPIKKGATKVELKEAQGLLALCLLECAGDGKSVAEKLSLLKELEERVDKLEEKVNSEASGVAD